MLIKIAGLVPESFVDGNGIRFAVFMQGCNRHCVGCHNPQTHDLDGGYILDTDSIIKLIKDNLLITGITLTGGEPLLQIDASIILAHAAKRLGLNVWCYTGFKYENLPDGADRLLDFVDVLVDGEFDITQRDLSLTFRGSRNQRLIDVRKSRKQNKIVLWG